ncbi:MAG: CPBP family intramembrane metalloprotease [Bacteroidales bacterium]|nr:CPBP family intramembrane metalloprotease [Bacteroidales bacterium]
MSENRTLSIIIFFSVLFFIIFIFLFYGKHASERKLLRIPGSGSLQRVVLERITGFFLFGIMPGIAIFHFLPGLKAADFGLVLPGRGWAIPALLFWLALITFMARYAGKPALLAHYPQIRTIPWGKNIQLINIFTWILYLVGYEFLFRGLLIFPLLGRFGITGTLLINIIVYTLAHVHKDKREIAGATVFGIFLGLMTIYSGSIWLSFMSHLTLALSNDYFSYRVHRRIQLLKQNEHDSL